ncbi:MAG TPA: hypothetical protein VMS98_07785 [Thermoanaerobaculia bacterium]|nr:hypothetical protein [Thermoanaerobaculia bacterium]
MRRVNVILLLLMMMIVMATLPVSAEDVKNEVFSIDLPAGYAAFIKQVQKQKSPEGEITATNWISKSPNGEAIVVTMSQMPGKILDPQKMMTSTRASLVKALGASLEQEEMREGAVPSARLLFYSDDAFFRSRLVIDDDRLYQILYVARTAEQRVSPAATQIFETFRISERVPAKSGVAAAGQ